MNSAERKSVSLGERWRREATRGVDDARLAQALDALPSIRKPMVRIRPGSIRCEMEGTMGSIHEVSLQIRTLPMREHVVLVRVLRRSKTIVDALENGRVPRSFDRLVARIVGEPLFPDARSVTFGCSCDLPERPCRHVLALHELFARRLDERPWEILMLRGIDLQAMLAKVRQTEPDADLPPLAFGVPEEPVLYPDAEDADLGQVLTPAQVRWFTGSLSERCTDAALKALSALSLTPPAPPEPPPPPRPAASPGTPPTPVKKQTTAEAVAADVERVRKSSEPS